QWVRKAMRSNVVVSSDVQLGTTIVDADESRFSSVIINLLMNAQDAMPNGGQIRVGAELSRLNPGFLEVFVEDEGEGICPEELENVKKDFYTTKGGKGAGLGLSEVHRFSTDCGGQLTIKSQLTQGTRVTLSIPARTCDTVQTSPSNVDFAKVLDGCRALLIEGNYNLQSSLRALFYSYGLSTTAVSTGEEAKDLLRGMANDYFDIVVTELELADKSAALEVAELAREINPKMGLLVFTTEPTENLAEESPSETVFIRQPIDPMRLMNALHDAHEKRQRAYENESSSGGTSP
ncbi:MAG: ATP-binding protein, partial [Planctomycetota bacterium]